MAISKRSSSNRNKKSLSHGRPPTAKKSTPSLSAKSTRGIIRTHHQLHKRLAQAKKDGDGSKIYELEEQIQANGGLKLYQQASITGQSSSRGGDSSKQLMNWLQIGGISSDSVREKLRMLEIGALSPNNACSTSGIFEITRIDLKSQHSDVEEQDFMQRPLPTDEADKFDILSLSLVLNYVADAAARGEMLRRTCAFLKSSTTDSPEISPQKTTDALFPSLFLVLPKPCVNNSRYMTENHLEVMMATLGFSKAKHKLSAKLYYSLWTYDSKEAEETRRFPKMELNPGKNRNNFCVLFR